jgi:hypothetical protein
MRGIFHPDLAPLNAPSEPYSAKPDVIAFRSDDSGAIMQEVFERDGGSFGFRYCAWVNFADSGAGAHHAWHEFHPASVLVADSDAIARREAAAHTKETGRTFGEWTTPKA